MVVLPILLMVRRAGGRGLFPVIHDRTTTHTLCADLGMAGGTVMELNIFMQICFRRRSKQYKGSVKTRRTRVHRGPAVFVFIGLCPNKYLMTFFTASACKFLLFFLGCNVKSIYVFESILWRVSYKMAGLIKATKVCMLCADL